MRFIVHTYRPFCFPITKLYE